MKNKKILIFAIVGMLVLSSLSVGIVIFINRDQFKIADLWERSTEKDDENDSEEDEEETVPDIDVTGNYKFEENTTENPTPTSTEVTNILVDVTVNENGPKEETYTLTKIN